MALQGGMSKGRFLSTQFGVPHGSVLAPLSFHYTPPPLDWLSTHWELKMEDSTQERWYWTFFLNPTSPSVQHFIHLWLCLKRRRHVWSPVSGKKQLGHSAFHWALHSPLTICTELMSKMLCYSMATSTGNHLSQDCLNQVMSNFVSFNQPANVKK